MFAYRVAANLLIDQLSAESYDPALLRRIAFVASGRRLSEFLTQNPKLGVTGTIASSYVPPTTPGAVPYLTTKQISGLFAYPVDCKFITAEADTLWSKCRVKHGAILINKSGDVGAAALLSAPNYPHVNSVSDLINITLREGAEGIDSAFLVVYLNSPYAQDQLKRLSGGAVFDHVSIYAIPDVRVACPDRNAQKYIGDKVRRAEELRQSAEYLAEAARQLVDDLIQGRISDRELAEAQLAIERGDGELDRALLQRLASASARMSALIPRISDIDTAHMNSGIPTPVETGERGN